MKYQAVILNFDRKTVQYVAPKDVPRPTKKAVTASSGTNPPTRKRD